MPINIVKNHIAMLKVYNFVEPQDLLPELYCSKEG